MPLAPFTLSRDRREPVACRRARALCLAVLALASCSTALAPAPAAVSSSEAAPAPPEPVRRLRGHAPGAALAEVILSADGSAAITIDRLARGLLWPALDGSLEPQRIPGTVERAALVRREVGFVVCTVDPAGGARILRHDDHGLDDEVLVELPPQTRAIDAVAVGQHFVLRLASGAVALFDGEGRELDRYEAREFPIDTVVTAGDRAILVGVAQDTAAGRVIAMRWLAIADGRLRRDRGLRDIQVATPSSAGQLVVADERRLAYIASENFTVLNAGDPEPRLGSVSIVDLSSGERTEVAAEIDGDTRLFLRSGRLYLAHLSSEMLWRIDQKSSDTLPFVPTEDTLRARGPTLAGVRGAELLIQRGADSYALGYAPMLAGASAISPDGQRFLVADGDSYLVEPIGGDEPGVVLDDPGEQPTLLRAAFVGKGRLLLLHETGWLRLIDWRSGKQLWSASTGVAYQRMEVTPAGQFLFLGIGDTLEGYRLREDGRLYLDLGVGVRDWGQLDPARADGAILWTLDETGGFRRYAASDIARDAREPDPIALPDGLVAVDASGRTYLSALDGESLLVTDEEQTRRVPLPPSAIPSRSQIDARTGLIVYRGRDGVLLAADAETGEVRWSRRFPPGTSVEIGAGHLVASGLEGSQLIALDSGEPTWARCVGSFRRRAVSSEAPAGTAGALCQ